ncbi:MAG: peroxidase, partial [Ferruginibacter sp.]|nr:peroxidase [Chitinophagaceae bacterium]
MQQLELSEIQGFLVKEYKDKSRSEYFLLQVTNAPGAKKFIASIAGTITNLASETNDIYLNIGLTNAGLVVLGLKETNRASFSREFREGMVTPHRQRLLGDFDSSAPENWNWGGPANEEIHLLLMVFGKDEAASNEYCNQLRQKFPLAGLKEVHQLSGYILPDGKEHFGFREGISQPAIIGSGVKGINNDNVNPGEFLMGYKNEYNVYPDTPLLKEKQGETGLLTDDAGGSGFKDLGRNGTYFVLRQLKEDVDGFWNFLNEHTKNDEGANPEESTKLAAKMMGRWPSGAPLVKFPDKDPGGLSDDNDFNYIKEDKLGYKCPFGAHARRANPRDNFEETGPKESLKLTRRHRIIRRTRLYGENFTASATHHTPNAEVGIFFGCFNADISRQFEFIQYTWANYPKFKQLYADPDPFIGVRESPGPGVDQNFTIPRPTANECITGLKSFVF